jgi:hypothetical protein
VAGVRKRRRPRSLAGATVIRDRVILTGNRQVARRLPAHHGGGGSLASGGGGGGGGAADDDLGRRLREAAEVIAEQARVNASWSARIPPSIKVSGGSGGVSIMSGAPPAYPNEVAGVRHPVFGGRGTSRPKAPWVTNKHRPFLAPAADERIGEAAQKFAQVLDDWAKKHGYE